MNDNVEVAPPKAVFHVNPPKSCEFCDRVFSVEFVDGLTKWGSWADMCLSCHGEHGIGLGLGRGQLYCVQEDGRWLKAA